MTRGDPTDPGRREALKRGSALAASALGGCACPMPSWRMGEPPPLRAGPLAPPPPKEGTLNVPLVVDAHCHIFNIEDVPAVPLLRGPVTHYLGESKSKLVYAFADVISGIFHLLAPSARTELRHLERLSAKYAESAAAVAQALDDELDRQRRRFSVIFSDAAQRSEFAERYAIQRKIFLDGGGPDIRVLSDVDELSAEGIYGRLKAGVPAIQPATVEFDPGQLIHFAFSLTSPRYLNLKTLQNAYRGGDGAPAVDVFCPSQLDFNHWLGCSETATVQDDQVRLLEQIAIMSRGSILPFVAYNPLTDILENNASFERVVRAVCKHGFIGVKIYPPMGFRPFGNALGPLGETCPARTDATQIEARLACLYEWCLDRNVPVMAHTSHSFGKTDGYNECAAPMGWELALQSFAGLRVQAGHFGGESEYALGPKQWAQRYVDLMSVRNGENLYVDLSNLGGLFASDSAVHEVINPLVLQPLSTTPRQIVADRMLYGSDWYMTQLTKGWRTYLCEASEYFAEIECREAVPGLRNRVLGLNAASLYGLDPAAKGGKETNWDRLTEYYKAKGIGTPAWMDKVSGPRPPERC